MLKSERREKKARKKRTGMVVDDSARKLAKIKKEMAVSRKEFSIPQHSGWWGDADPYYGRSRPD